jgi:hypothetical protein
MVCGGAFAQTAGIPAAEQKGFATLRAEKLRADLTAWRFGDEAKTPVFVPNPKPEGSAR